MLRIPHCLDSQFINGGKVVSLTHKPNFTSQKHYYFNFSGTHFCQRLSKSQGLVRPKGLGVSMVRLLFSLICERWSYVQVCEALLIAGMFIWQMWKFWNLLYVCISVDADHSGRAVCLRPLKHWGRGSSPNWGMGVCVCLFCVVALLLADPPS
jgi:hypothetical protein